MLEKLDIKFGPVGFVNRVLHQFKNDRQGLSELENLSLAALDRFQLDDEYRPESLEQIYHKLYGLSEAEWGDLRGQMIA